MHACLSTTLRQLLAVLGPSLRGAAETEKSSCLPQTRFKAQRGSRRSKECGEASTHSDVWYKPPVPLCSDQPRHPSQTRSSRMTKDTIPANAPSGAGVQIPSAMVPLVRPHARKLMDILYKFVHEECIPAVPVYHAQMGKGIALSCLFSSLCLPSL